MRAIKQKLIVLLKEGTNLEKKYVQTTFAVIKIGILVLAIILLYQFYKNISEGVEIVDQAESRLIVIAEHLEADPSEVIIENSFFSSTYHITFNGSQYKAQFDYDDKGNAAVTNFSLVND